MQQSHFLVTMAQPHAIKVGVVSKQRSLMPTWQDRMIVLCEGGLTWLEIRGELPSLQGMDIVCEGEKIFLRSTTGRKVSNALILRIRNAKEREEWRKALSDHIAFANAKSGPLVVSPIEERWQSATTQWEAEIRKLQTFIESHLVERDIAMTAKQNFDTEINDLKATIDNERMKSIAEIQTLQSEIEKLRSDLDAAIRDDQANRLKFEEINSNLQSELDSAKDRMGTEIPSMGSLNKGLISREEVRL